MKTTAIYVRVSTERQSQAQTIEQQVERLHDHLRAEGQLLADNHIFRDDGYSGASLNRPGLDQLRDQVRRACFERVLITSPDRLARRFVHQILLIEEWERAGCQVEFLDRPMSQDPHDQLLLQIRGAVAEYERVLIAERMRRGRQLKLRSELCCPGPCLRMATGRLPIVLGTPPASGSNRLRQPACKNCLPDIWRRRERC